MFEEVFKKYSWIVLAGDFNSPLARNYSCVRGFQRYPELFGISSPVIGISSRENRIKYIGDISSWTTSHNEIKNKVEEDNDFLEKLIDATNKIGEAFNEWTEQNIVKVNLEEIDDQQIVALVDEFSNRQGEMYAYGTTLPILDFGGFSFVEGNLKKILEKKVSQEDYEKYYEILTEPIYNSFAQDQEEDLLRLMDKFYLNRQWREDVSSKTILELMKLYPEFYFDLKEHTVKHAWVYYVFTGPPYSESDFLDFIRDNLRKNVHPGAKLKEIRTKKIEIAKLRDEYIKSLGPNNFERMILHLVGKLVWAKPRRKDYQSKSYYHLEKLQREIARRLTISLSQVRSLPIDLLADALEKRDVDLSLVNSVYRYHICLPDGKGGVVLLYGRVADDFYNEFVEEEEIAGKEDIKEIKGTAAFKGKVNGIVKVINSPIDMYKMQDGDILVSLATAPSLVPAMKKAAAIVTDEGGLTCHASIVSRELGITCLVGTKFATKVLRDGMHVEVDAGSGVVRIL